MLQLKRTFLQYFNSNIISIEILQLKPILISIFHMKPILTETFKEVALICNTIGHTPVYIYNTVGLTLISNN